jgi:hypothetical protein
MCQLGLGLSSQGVLIGTADAGQMLTKPIAINIFAIADDLYDFTCGASDGTLGMKRVTPPHTASVAPLSSAVSDRIYTEPAPNCRRLNNNLS